MNNKILFISDIHLGAHSEIKNYQIENSLINIVDFCEKNGFRIVLLGDLYDYWMEYDYYRPAIGHRLIKRFRDFHKYNPPTLYITGNHDCWMKDYHVDAGFDVECEYRILKLPDQKILLHHGDGIDKPELALPRPFMNRILRSRSFLNTFQRLLPAKTGISIMKATSKFSRLAENLKPTSPERLNCWSKDILSNSALDAVICGHDHIPRVLTYGDKQYINTGAFYKSKKIAVYNSSKLELVTWSKQFIKSIETKTTVVNSY